MKSRALNRFVWLTAGATLFLICSGGMVTSKGVGLAVPDWPTTFGYNMFLFPVSRWVGGIFFEHTHRLIASTVGFLTIILAIWIWRSESRRWLRVLGLLSLGAVVLQGVLGGLRVTMLKDEIGIFHACLAQAFLGMLVFIGVATSRAWNDLHGRANVWLPLLTTALIYLQLALGATMRHQHRDLSILDFPLAYGQVIPDTAPTTLATINDWREARALSTVTAGQIWLQMAHRFVALLIAAGVFASFITTRRLLPRLSAAWFVFVALQVTLGAWTIWSNKAADIATAHVAVGATIFALGVGICALVLRYSGSSHTCHRCTHAAGGARVVKTATVAIESRPRIFADFAELVKARLTLLVLLTTAVGFYLGARESVQPLALFHAVFGTALAAAGAAALNQWWERQLDALMHRTRARPIPAGRMAARDALILGSILLGGIVYLAAASNALAAFLAGLTIVLYIFAYTPLKRISTTNTLIGAIPGAIPPMIGWAAARGALDLGAWSLFTILFFWQMPHFFALSWMYRADYARAGFRMVSSDDESGARSSSQSVLFCMLLLIVSGIPFYIRLTSAAYLGCALALSAFFIAMAMRFHQRRTAKDARNVFLASIIYLPLLLAALVLTKT